MAFQLWVYLFLVLLSNIAASTVDIIRENQSIKDGRIIVSDGGKFEMGFFTRSRSSAKRYRGIWYKKISNGGVVWVANRENPVEEDHSGVLKRTLPNSSIKGLKISSKVSLWKIAASAVDTIVANQSITDGQTIVSAGGTFEMGFFSPSRSSTKRYLGIWYKNISDGPVVWVANRENPLEDDHSGVLKLSDQGNLILLSNSTGDIIWSSNSFGAKRNPISQLLDTGNLVVKDESHSTLEDLLWQSFDYPTDSLLPGMKLGFNKRTGMNWSLTSWKSKDDPVPGDTVLRLDHHGYPQLFLRIGSEVLRAGPWNGIGFSGEDKLTPGKSFLGRFVLDHGETYFMYEYVNESIFSRFVVETRNAYEQRWTWNSETHSWNASALVAGDQCAIYGLCGVNARCSKSSSPLLMCNCLENFVPKDSVNWNIGEWSAGCVRRISLDCRRNVGFIRYSGMKLPDTRNSWYDLSISLEECKLRCSSNCSCTAYTNLDIRWRGSGCLLWFGDLIDIKDSTYFGQELYIRIAQSNLGETSRNKKRIIITSLAIVTCILLLGSLVFFFCRQKAKRKGKMIHYSQQDFTNASGEQDLQLPVFDFNAIMKATDNFSIVNKLGQGGFGIVYKGILKDGQEIAVKRLSKNSSQGLDEFKNEVIFVAKLQHRNLAKLLGCCIHDEEKLLIYEYMPNKSLDSFIFDRSQSALLDWPKRFHIINGIARGLQYLHQDSRLRVIHRDMKTSNILLDDEFIPKISDFGMARCFGGNCLQANTKIVVGTYGYMSPEYIIDGLFSTKSDIFSFGVIMLEVISGERNWRFCHPDHDLNLLGHAWKLFTEDKSLKLVDEAVEASNHLSQIKRSIHVALQCVQKSPEDRPDMSSVIVMLSSETMLLPPPKQPGFFVERMPLLDDHTSVSNNASENDFTVTILEGR